MSSFVLDSDCFGFLQLKLNRKSEHWHYECWQMLKKRHLLSLTYNSKLTSANLGLNIEICVELEYSAGNLISSPRTWVFR